MSHSHHLIDSPWLQFKQHIVRELAFVIASPPLLQQWSDPVAPHAIALPDSQFWQHHFAHYLPRLKQLDQHPTALQQHVQALRSRRLGIRFESLLTFWLLDTRYHPYQLIGKNIQVKAQQRTLGELDFLLLNTDTQRIEHWEVAVKFYLGEGALTPKQWIGLNYNDSLDKKLNHLYRHQFKTTSVEQYPIQDRKAIMKGRLFYPAHQQTHTTHMPAWLNPQHLRGIWGYAPPDTQNLIRYVSRNEWFCQTHNTEGTTNTAPYYRQGLYLVRHPDQHIQHYMLRINSSRVPFLTHNASLQYR